MKSLLIRLSLVVATLSVGITGCSSTTITALTQPPPGREATLDVELATLTVSRGLAVVLECTEYLSDGYSGPCRTLDVDVAGDEVVDVFAVNLDAVAGSTVGDYGEGTNLTAPSPRSGVLLAATAAGEATLTLDAGGEPVELSLVVNSPDPADEE